MTDPADADEAKRLVEQHIAERDAARVESGGGGVMSVVCEECGNEFTLPAVQRGTVQQCPGCRAHVDVPAADQDEADDLDGETGDTDAAVASS